MEIKTLREWRLSKYMSPATLARRAEVAKATISRMEHGTRTSYRLETLKTVADALQVLPEQIMEFIPIIEGKENHQRAIDTLVV